MFIGWGDFPPMSSRSFVGWPGWYSIDVSITDNGCGLMVATTSQGSLVKCSGRYAIDGTTVGRSPNAAQTTIISSDGVGTLQIGQTAPFRWYEAC